MGAMVVALRVRSRILGGRRVMGRGSKMRQVWVETEQGRE